MGTFTQYLSGVAERGEVVNTLFEERLFGLVSVLRRITEALAADGIPYELIGGLAVLVYVEEADPEHSTLTRDVDLMVRRDDLERIKTAVARSGFRFRHVRGVDMLIFGDTDSARNAVHLVFSGEKVRPDQSTPNPALAPARKEIQGTEVMVIPIADLVQMKLSAFRDKDRVHIRSMDAAGLITPPIQRAMPPELRARLQHIRETE